jgi:hypothetical protein
MEEQYGERVREGEGEGMDCPKCEGTGKVGLPDPHGQVCFDCSGTGWLADDYAILRAHGHDPEQVGIEGKAFVNALRERYLDRWVENITPFVEYP